MNIQADQIPAFALRTVVGRKNAKASSPVEVDQEDPKKAGEARHHSCPRTRPKEMRNHKTEIETDSLVVD